jgi:hypothetical protein
MRYFAEVDKRYSSTIMYRNVPTTAQRVQFRTRTVSLCEQTEGFTMRDNYWNDSFDT